MMGGAQGATRIYVAVGATDMRKGFNGLHGLVLEKVREDPLSGHWFVFCNERRNRLKVFYWDGSGFWICAKRLEKGRFSWRMDGEGKVVLNAQEFAMLVGGYEMEKIRRKSWYLV